MNEIESFSALMKLSRTSTNNLIDNRWPDESFEKKWYSFIEYLKSFNDSDKSLAEITEKKLEVLQKLLDLFFISRDKNIDIIRNKSKKNIPQILYSINRLKVNGKPFSDIENHVFFIKFIKKIPTEDFPSIAVPIMKYYLNTKKQDKDLKNFIINIFSTFDSSVPIYERDLNLYIDKEYINNKIHQEKNGTTLNECLLNIGVSSRYLSTLYMRALFFNWFFKLSKYSFEILQKNKTSIDECTSDEKKLLFASIINNTFKKNTISDKDSFIRRVDESFFPTPKIDKTESEYWTLVTDSLESEKTQILLKNAHRYYVNIFTRFIITKFFDSLSDIASDRNGQVRANYWRKYGTSDAFIDIKLVINNWQKRKVYEGLTSSEIQKFSKHIIRNCCEGYSESPVFIIIFTTKIVAIFLQTGHSAQVFNTDNIRIRSLLNQSYVDTSKMFSIYTTGSLYNNYEDEGRVIQNGSWQYSFTNFLSRNGIVQGKE